MLLLYNTIRLLWLDFMGSCFNKCTPNGCIYAIKTDEVKVPRATLSFYHHTHTNTEARFELN